MKRDGHGAWGGLSDCWPRATLTARRSRLRRSPTRHRAMLQPLSGAGPNYLGCCTPTDKADAIACATLDRCRASAIDPCVCRKPRPFDLMKESRTVGHDGRAALLPFEAVTFALQADQPTRG